MIRRPRPEGDDGYALIFVMLVTLLITIATGTMIAIAADNIGSARRSQQSETALALADAGLQDYVANLNAHCVSYSVDACPWLEAQQSTPLTGTLTTGSYSAKAESWHDYLSENNGVVRVSSTGTTTGVSRTLVADISGEPSVLRFAYFSDYETIGSSLLNSYYPTRSFTVSGAAASAAGITSGSTVHWNGASTTPSDNYTDSVCDQLYYSTPGSSQQGRYQIKQTRTSLPLGTDFAEDGTVTPPLLGSASPVTRYGTCEVTFSKGMSFDGPVYTRDAPYLSNGTGGSSTGPSFVVANGEPLPAASTAWSTSDTPAADSANPYRSFPLLGGAPAVANSVKTLPFDLSLPSSVSGADSSATVCTGDTTIVLSGSTATLSGAGSSCAGHNVSVDLTTISVHGTASVQGNLTSGRLSLVATQDIVVTGDLTTTCGQGQTCRGTNEFGEPSWTSGPAIDLVALDNVRVDHQVKCVDGSAQPSTGYCANDITGLYTTDQASAVVNSDGTLKSAHPAMQYTNKTGTGNREIDAAIFALTGSFYTDNFNRGAALGTLTVNGGIYQNHRGPLGQEWEVSSTATSRAYSGYKLDLSYVSYQSASLPYVPALQGGTPDSPWEIIAVSSPTAGGS